MLSGESEIAPNKDARGGGAGVYDAAPRTGNDREVVVVVMGS